MNIYGNKVILRAIEKKDLDILWKAINDPELEKMEDGSNFPISRYAQDKWLDNLSNNGGKDYRFIIEYDDEAIGWISLINIDWKNRCAHSGVKLFTSEYRGRGLALDGVMAIMRYAFDELNLHRLEGSIFPFNQPSYKLYVERAGWKEEGIRRQAIYQGGQYLDVIKVSILKKEYYALIQRTKYWDTKA